MIDYKSLVCGDCGMKHGRNPGEGRGLTIWQDTCAICGKETGVSPFYDYGGPKGANREHTCPRNADAHALCAKLAESEARMKELEAKLAGVDDALVSCYYHDDCQAPAYCGVCANAIRDGHEPNCAVPQAITREEARKKGAEHGA